MCAGRRRPGILRQLARPYGVHSVRLRARSKAPAKPRQRVRAPVVDVDLGEDLERPVPLGRAPGSPLLVVLLVLVARCGTPRRRTRRRAGARERDVEAVDRRRRRRRRPRSGGRAAAGRRRTSAGGARTRRATRRGRRRAAPALAAGARRGSPEAADLGDQEVVGYADAQEAVDRREGVEPPEQAAEVERRAQRRGDPDAVHDGDVGRGSARVGPPRLRASHPGVGRVERH